MKDVEIVVFNDKSWVRFTDYQKLKDRYEALEETNEYQNDAICMLQKQIKKMKCCENCNYGQVWADGVYCSVSGEAEHLSDYSRERALYCDKWELAE